MRQRARLCICIAAVAMTVFVLIQPGWTWAPLVFGIVITTASTIAATGDLPRGRRRGGGFSGRGRDDDDEPVSTAAPPWRMLVIVSRLMPRSAGLRWLAEAESLLSEITARLGSRRRG